MGDERRREGGEWVGEAEVKVDEEERRREDAIGRLTRKKLSLRQL